MNLPMPMAFARPDPRRLAAAQGRLHVAHAGFLYAGAFLEVTNQRPSAVVYLSLGDAVIEVSTGATTVVADAVLVGPGVSKRVTAGNRLVALIDVGPTYPLFPALTRASGDVTPWPRAHFEPALGALMAFRRGELDAAGSDRLYEQLVALAGELVPAVPPLDPRVREVMRLLRQEPGLSTAALAKAVHLSKDWLAHLFQREVGIPLRKYEQAMKVQAAAAYLRRGVTLTEVAAMAGFSDSAHFSRLWKRHYGFPPQRAFMGDEVFFDPMPWPPCLASARAPRLHEPGSPLS